MTEIPTDEGKLYLATVLDLFSRRLLACPTSIHPDARLAADAIMIAATARGGRCEIDGVIFHTDSKYGRCQVFPGFVTLTPIDPRGYRGVGGVLAAS